ncbi:hypothetical protein, partial [Paenibacillus gansuensis]
VYTLRKTALRMYPFYRKIVRSRTYSDLWAKAVVKADLDAMQKLLFAAIGKQNLASLSTNAIGYFVDFPVRGSKTDVVSASTSIRPGQVQFTFSAAVHRRIAKAVLPFYRELVLNKGYAVQVVRAIRTQNAGLLEKLVRSKVPTSALRKVEAGNGFFLGFKYPQSKYVYYNQIFQDRLL